MNLCIDQGNSRTKVAIFDADGKVVNDWMFRSKDFHAADVEKIFKFNSNITSSIISSVINIDPSVVNTLNRLSKHFVLFDSTTQIPIANHYATPNTLGQDRMAAAVGACELLPDKNLLVIDIGSAVTYDYVSATDGFMGGNIAPGLKMRLRALRYFTGKLPKVETTENELIPLFGDNTRDAMAAGVINGLCFEIKGYMQELKERIGDFSVVLTGGNANYFRSRLPNNIVFERRLVLIGLNRILNDIVNRL